MAQQTARKPIVEHNYKVLAEGATLHFLGIESAKATRDTFTKVGVKAYIMVKLYDGSYVPLAE